MDTGNIEQTSLGRRKKSNQKHIWREKRWQYVAQNNKQIISWHIQRTRYRNRGESTKTDG